MRRHPNKTIPGPVGDEPTIEQRWTRWVAKRKENHTGPTDSFKGIDNSTYYAISDNPQSPYENFAGVGNAIHSPNRTVRKMILDSLRHWVTEMHVDGFRFDLASLFSRNSDGTITLTDPMLFADIMSDQRVPGKNRGSLLVWTRSSACTATRSRGWATWRCAQRTSRTTAISTWLGDWSRQAFNQADRIFTSSIRSFRALSVSEAENIRPHRVDLYIVRVGDTWDSLAARSGGAIKAGTLAVMTNAAPDSRPQQGTRIKIVVGG